MTLGTPESHLNEARFLVDRGEPAEAIRRLRDAVALFRRSAPLWKLLGSVLASQGRDAEALDAYRASTELVARDADVWTAMAVLAHRLGQPGRALTCWKSALWARPTLFVERPALRALWRECRDPGPEFRRAALRLVNRQDASAAVGFLDEVLLPDEVDIALSACHEALSHRHSKALAIASAALYVVAHPARGAPALCHALDERDERGAHAMSEAFLQRIIAAVARLSGDRWDDTAAAICMEGDIRAVRACYRYVPQSSPSSLMALTAMIHMCVATVRDLEQHA